MTKRWLVRTGYWLADGSSPVSERIVEASSMEAAMAKGIREGRLEVVPPRRKVVQIRSRVEVQE
jgi:hypothetical protein